MNAKIFATNPLAKFNYFIKSTFEAGIVLEGWEVGAIRKGNSSIKEAYVINKNGNIEIIGMHITPLSSSSNTDRNPTRTRRLLLNKSEINKIIGLIGETGQSVIPLEIYESMGKIKICIGMGQGKKQHDKRETIKDRDWNREQSRIMKRR